MSQQRPVCQSSLRQMVDPRRRLISSGDFWWSVVPRFSRHIILSTDLDAKNVGLLVPAVSVGLVSFSDSLFNQKEGGLTAAMSRSKPLAASALDRNETEPTQTSSRSQPGGQVVGRSSEPDGGPRRAEDRETVDGTHITPWDELNLPAPIEHSSVQISKTALVTSTQRAGVVDCCLSLPCCITPAIVSSLTLLRSRFQKNDHSLFPLHGRRPRE
ncbi:hypothetical protein IWX49DRAFT_582657 [Phyllosticta citricarpa]